MNGLPDSSFAICASGMSVGCHISWSQKQYRYSGQSLCHVSFTCFHRVPYIHSRIGPAIFTALHRLPSAACWLTIISFSLVVPELSAYFKSVSKFLHGQDSKSLDVVARYVLLESPLLRISNAENAIFREAWGADRSPPNAHGWTRPSRRSQLIAIEIFSSHTSTPFGKI